MVLRLVHETANDMYRLQSSFESVKDDVQTLQKDVDEVQDQAEKARAASEEKRGDMKRGLDTRLEEIVKSEVERKSNDEIGRILHILATHRPKNAEDVSCILRSLLNRSFDDPDTEAFSGTGAKATHADEKNAEKSEIAREE